MKSIIKEFIPPFFLNYLTAFFYGWRGDYTSWKEALSHSIGYDHPAILEKVKEAALRVKQQQACYERDAVTFNQPSYSFPLLTALFFVARQYGNKIHVLDFGGSLGSTYFRNRQLIQHLDFKWCVVEQPHFVEEGNRHFSDSFLSFYPTIRQCCETCNIHLALFSSSLPYVEDPFAVIQEVIREQIPFLFIDRMPLLTKGANRITIQKVHPAIYRASYPCHLFNEQYFLQQLEPDYSLIYEFVCPENINVRHGLMKGYFMEKKGVSLSSHLWPDSST
jgi:putative methyltransferase (TIGR04325 family)